MISVSTSGQAFDTKGKKSKDNSTIVDITGDSILVNKKDKKCVEKLGGSKDAKDQQVCAKSASEKYVGASEHGFWFYDEQSSKLSHLTLNTSTDVKSSTVLKKFRVRPNSNILIGYTCDGDTVASEVFIYNAGAIVQLYKKNESCFSPSTAIEKDHRFVLVCTNPLEKNDLYRFEVEYFKVGESGKAVKLSKSMLVSDQVQEYTLSSNPRNVWVKPPSESEKKFSFFVNFKDDRIAYINEYGNEAWSKKTAIEDVQDVLVAEFPSDDEEDEVSDYENVKHNPIAAIIHRLKNDVVSLIRFATTLLPRLKSLSIDSIIAQLKGHQDLTITDKIGYLNKHGLRRNLIFLSKHKRLVSVDSLSGKTLWEFSVKHNEKIVNAFVNANNNIDLVWEETVQGGTAKRYLDEVSSLTGKFVSNPRTKVISSKANLYLEGDHGTKPMEIGFKDNYLANPSKGDQVFYRVDENKGITGYRWNGVKGAYEEIWSYDLESSQKIIGYSYHNKDDDQYLTKTAKGYLVTLPEEEALYFKVVDSSNVALFIKQTVQSKEVLVLTIINTIRGKIIGTYTNENVDFNQPVVFLYDDNGIFVSYFNPKVPGFELWTTEIFKMKVETSFIEMLQKYVFKVKSEEELDYSKDIAQYIILDRKYGLSAGLKYLGAVSSLHGLARRNLLGITYTNDVTPVLPSDHITR